VIGKLQVLNVTRRDVIQLLDKILDRGSNSQANKTLALLKQLFQYAVERGIIENSPIASVRKKSVGGVTKPRERCLSDDEIITLWQRIEETPFEPICDCSDQIIVDHWATPRRNNQGGMG
jgi:site-specific recombinase XerD